MKLMIVFTCFYHIIHFPNRFPPKTMDIYTYITWHLPETWRQITRKATASLFDHVSSWGPGGAERIFRFYLHGEHFAPGKLRQFLLESHGLGRFRHPSLQLPRGSPGQFLRSSVVFFLECGWDGVENRWFLLLEFVLGAINGKSQATYRWQVLIMKD